MKWLEALLSSPPIHDIPRATVHGTVEFTLLLLGFIVLERILGRSIARYRSRRVALDYVYCIFYNGGYFAAIYYPLLKMTNFLSAPIQLNLLPQMPLYLSIPIFYVVADFSFYWAHRTLHTKYFWPFHSVHHSQTELTVLTTARFHVLDVIVLTLFTGVPATIIGLPIEVQAVSWILMLQDKMEHANLPWTFGPLYRIVVSPRFHRIHHSVESSARNRNFGRLFSVWDYLFGTAHENVEEPAAFGIDGAQLPESLLPQFVTPFRRLWSMVRRPVVPLPQVSPS